MEKTILYLIGLLLIAQVKLGLLIVFLPQLKAEKMVISLGYNEVYNT